MNIHDKVTTEFTYRINKRLDLRKEGVRAHKSPIIFAILDGSSDIS